MLLISLCLSGLFMQSKTSAPRDTTVKAGQAGDINPKIKDSKTYQIKEEHNKCGTMMKSISSFSVWLTTVKISFTFYFVF